MSSIIEQLEQLVEDAQRKSSDDATSQQMAYWRGVLFGLETAIAEIKERISREETPGDSAENFSKN